jgi:(p)ppGpp synthase/HD superfamily hydrolase
LSSPSLPAYTERFDEAVALAVSAFRPVFRKRSSIPYVAHLFSVTALVAENGGDEDLLCAAMLHDYLEDIAPDGVGLLRARFGERVASIVVALSDAMEHPKPPWRERKERYVAHLRHADPSVKLVSAADKLHNVRSTRSDVAREGLPAFRRFAGEVDGTLWYYDAICDALADGWEAPLLTLLRHEVEGLADDVARLRAAG